MNNIYAKNILRFILLVLLQIFILNNIRFNGYINPFLYIVFILWLPLNTPKWVLLVSSFFIGISIDVFSDTAGMHAAASVFMAYIRPSVIRLLTHKQEADPEAVPSIKHFGFRWFLFYSAILTTAHHLLLFYIEVFRFSEFFATFYRAMLSVIASLLLILIVQYLATKK